MIKKINYKKGKRFNFGTHLNEFLIPRERTKSSETFLVVVHPQKSTHLHKHPDMEQVFFVIEGHGVLWTKTGSGEKLKQACEMKIGDIIFIPTGHWHQISCVSKTRLEYLCFNAFPGGHLSGESTAIAHAKNVVKSEKEKKRKNKKR